MTPEETEILCMSGMDLNRYKRHLEKTLPETAVRGALFLLWTGRKDRRLLTIDGAYTQLAQRADASEAADNARIAWTVNHARMLLRPEDRRHFPYGTAATPVAFTIDTVTRVLHADGNGYHQQLRESLSYLSTTIRGPAHRQTILHEAARHLGWAVHLTNKATESEETDVQRWREYTFYAWAAIRSPKDKTNAILPT